MSLVSESNGKWDSNVALAILRAVGMEDANVREEDASRELKVVRKYAIGLRDKLNRCADAVQYLREALQLFISLEHRTKGIDKATVPSL